MAEEEIKLNDSIYLVSRSDLNGFVTYANDEFCKVTGYSKEEIIGQNHNIIRHPDMPNVLFAEMWKTIKKGKKWRGFVKNKTKDGRFYWVDAEVSPFVKDGRHLGYKSIRRYVSDEVIAQVEKKYAKIKKDESGEFSSWTVERDNYRDFDELSKKLNLSKKELFEKMLECVKKSGV